MQGSLRFVERGVIGWRGDIETRLEVSQVLGDVVTDVETWYFYNELARREFEMKKKDEMIRKLREEKMKMHQEKEEIDLWLQQKRTEANQVRNSVVRDLCHVMEPLRKVSELEDQLKETSRRMVKYAELLKNRSDKSIVNIRTTETHVAPVHTAAGIEMSALDRLDNKDFLRILSYLSPEDVMAMAAGSHQISQRIHALLRSPSQDIQDTRPPLPSSSTSPSLSPSPGDNDPGLGSLAMSVPLSQAKRSLSTQNIWNPLMNWYNSSSSGKPPLFVSNLTKAEIKTIMAMVDRLKKLEQVLATLSAEKEDVSEKLEGAEKVKQFLVTKLKETETALKRSWDQINECGRQATSDREVISFLDGRVQEVEKIATEERSKREEAEIQLETERKNMRDQLRSLEDTLRYERQKMIESENTNSNKIKVLVKEVKNLRTNLAVVKSEREELAIQVRELRQSVVKLQNGARLR